MKYTIIALVGMAQGFAVIDKFGRTQQIEEFVQINDDTLVQDVDYDEVPASMIDSPAAGGYERDSPAQFTEERDDRLMNSLYQNYAREIKRDGQLTGAFFLNKDDAFAATMEVVTTHFKWSADKAKKWLSDGIFADTWSHYDVNKDGLVEVERMPMFLRSVTGNALDIDLQ